MYQANHLGGDNFTEMNTQKMNTPENYPLPFIHSNGTGAKDLFAEYDDAEEKLIAFIYAWKNITCNGRDYYPINQEAYSLAREKREEISAKILEVKEYIKAHQVHIYKHLRK
jgi:hypothetical protein